MNNLLYLLGKELPLTSRLEGRVSWPAAAHWKFEGSHKEQLPILEILCGGAAAPNMFVLRTG